MDIQRYREIIQSLRRQRRDLDSLFEAVEVRKQAICKERNFLVKWGVIQVPAERAARRRDYENICRERSVLLKSMRNLDYEMQIYAIKIKAKLIDARRLSLQRGSVKPSGRQVPLDFPSVWSCRDSFGNCGCDRRLSLQRGSVKPSGRQVPLDFPSVWSCRDSFGNCGCDRRWTQPSPKALLRANTWSLKRKS